MMVYKYILELTDFQTMAIPVGAKIVAIQEQRGHITLWMVVNPDVRCPVEDREFHIVGTGNGQVNDNDEYIGTVQLGSLVWHVFEVL